MTGPRRPAEPAADWRRAVIYQVYLRSFRDSDGDGVGDLRGLSAGLDHLAGLGVDAVWLSPIHPSPDADFGYDVADYTAVDPRLGSLADVDVLIERAGARGIGVVLDWVVNHTSDQHPWFRAALSSPADPHRPWYLFRDGRSAGEPPNNWRSMFGGSAWQHDDRSGQWYLHTFFPGQPDLDWRRPAVRAAVAAAMRFWLDRGVAGFRLDALPLLMKDAALRDNPVNPQWTPGMPDYWRVRPARTADQPEMTEVVEHLRRVVDGYGNRVLLGEMGLPPDRLARYHQHIHVPLNFGLITEPFSADRLARRIERYLAALPAPAWPNWALGSHDVPRVATRLGPELARAAAVVQLTLPGTVTIYQGDELGLPDGPQWPDGPLDPLGRIDPGRSRDPARTPLPWDGSACSGFTTGRPWLPTYADGARRSIAAQAADPASPLALYRRLLRLRRAAADLAAGPVTDLSADGGVLGYCRGRYRVLAQLADGPAEIRLPAPARPVLSSRPGQPAGGPVDRVRLDGPEAIVLELPGPPEPAAPAGRPA